MTDKKDVLILASGGGSNAEAIVSHAQKQELPIRFVGGCNISREKAGVYERLEKLNVPVHYLPSPKTDFSALCGFLDKNRFDLIVLAGYMRVLPADIADNYRIVNIHPSILPFVYKGSMDAYKDAMDNGDIYTGCTVHQVTSEVDAGPILAQIAFEIPPLVRKDGDLDTLKKIGLAHEHALYPAVVASVVLSGKYILNAPIKMIRVADQAKKNLADRELPAVDKFIPLSYHRGFLEFNPKEVAWKKKILYCGR